MAWSIDSLLTYLANNFATLVVALATFTVAIATFVLAWYSRSLVIVTKALSEASERARVRPILNFDAQQPLADARGEWFRFSVNNYGFGPAIDLKAMPKVVNGRDLKVKALTAGTILPNGGTPYYWDIFEVKVGEDIEVEVDYSDSLRTPQPTLKLRLKAK